MRALVLGALQLVWLVASSPTDSGRLLVDSRPILFEEEPNLEATEVVNSTLLLKKKSYSGGPVYYANKPDTFISNHNPEGTVWIRPQKPLSAVISNHKSYSNWNQPKWMQKLSTSTPSPHHIKDQTSTHEGKFVVINNHRSNKHPVPRPQKPTSVVTVEDTAPNQQAITDVLGERVKAPEVIKSPTINVLNPTNLATTIVHNKLIVLQKRTDQLDTNDIHVQKPVKDHSSKPNKLGNFSVAPVMDPWSNIPLPSQPSWATSNPVKGSDQPVGGGFSQQPVRGGYAQQAVGGGFGQQSVGGGFGQQAVVGGFGQQAVTGVVAQASQPATSQTVLPNLPFMPFLSSLIMPLLSKPLTPSALNSGMQGIKAMQSFLRNSLLGAMFCFLPSAFIALSLSATQRSELRKLPEMDTMVIYCKTCLENLKKIKESLASKEPKWMKEES